MDKVKAFFAKDIVKIIAGAVLVVANGLILKYVPDLEMRLWLVGLLTSIGGYLGIVSGGTSNLNSTASQARAEVTAKIAPKP